MYKRFRRIHFVGIGGMGMSGIAEVLLNLHYQVSGSDLAETEITRRLKKLGARVYKGHRSSHIQDPDAVVISSAVSPNNSEVLEARRLKIPVIPRAEMLAELMRMKYGIAIAGTHGKTTTTSMVASLLASCGVDPTVVIGGRLNRWGTNAKLGQGEFLVAEADESDGSFHLLSPAIAVVTNIDNDHLDYYKSLNNIKKSFITFLNRLPFYGVGIVCGDDKQIQSILKYANKRMITYGISSGCDYQAREIRYRGLKSFFKVYHRGKRLGSVTIHTAGIHNVKNALAALAVGMELSLSFQKIKKGLSAYSGVQRRFQIRGKIKGITILDDYGHHPTEIEAVLKTCRQVWPRKRLVVVFQPHRYSRTQALMNEFVDVFRRADVLVLTEIYAAGEKPIAGVSGSKLFDRLRRRHRHVYFFPESGDLARELKKMVRRDDIVLTLGAGDIWKVGEQLLRQL